MDETNEIYEGSVIGNYRVVAMLGQGGMGTVYEVEHQELGTHYALKTFTFDPGHEASGALKRKFLEEGRLLARLKHPNLTHVFDLGFEEKTQMPYFVMDLVTYEDGGTYTVEDVDLADIDEDLAYKWFKQLASALDYIHGEGIVHRDIKPGNLLVDKDLNVILTDFGISRIFGAKIKSEVDATRTVVTKTGRGKLVLGTVQYIAPEVAAGNEATPQADAYSLGVMLLRWLTGFDYRDNPGAIALLSKKKYRWLPVISQLLAPFGRRPENYTELLKLLKPPAPASKPAAKPAVEPKQPVKQLPEKKTGVFNGLIAAGIAGLLAVGGYFVWRQSEIAKENDRRQREQMAAIQKQLEEAKAEKETEAKRIAEEKRAAEEKRIAEEKRVAEEKRIAEEKKEQLQEPVVVPTPIIEQRSPKTSETVIAQVEFEESQEKPKVEVRTKETFGPIPNVKYIWRGMKDGGKPLPVQFHFANGSKMDLLPNRKGMFYMSNWNGRGHDVKTCHKVRFTYDFWISKHLVTAEQWREYAPYDCEDCRELEDDLKGECQVVKKFSSHSITSYCGWLSRKYKSQLPNGYVFRLPTEAELEYATVGDSTVEQLRSDHEFWNKCSSVGETVSKKVEKLRKGKRLDKHGQLNKEGGLAGKGKILAGLAEAFPTGIFDVWFPSGCPVSDRLEWLNVPVNYADEEVDPLHWTESEDAEALHYRRVWEKYRERTSSNEKYVFHIVMAPDLGRLNKYDEAHVRAIKEKPRKVPERRYNFSIPKEVSRPRELKFKLANGADMIFNACPAGKFIMSNVRGQDKESHKVEITRPFWMTKYNVTIEQWEDFAENDYPGVYKKIQKAFAKYPVSIRIMWKQWIAYCNYLNTTYGHLLPKNHVFRLPSEAEWEYAYFGGERRDKIDSNEIWTETDGHKRAFAKMLKKNKGVASLGKWSECGYFSDIFIGGRAKPHRWGFCDMRMGATQMMLDTFDYECKEWHGDATKHVLYPDKAIDPLYWAGYDADHLRALLRQHSGERWIVGVGFNSYARIVIGPDLVKEKEVGK